MTIGFFLIDIKSGEEAIEWAMGMPDPQGYGEGQIGLCQVFDLSSYIHPEVYILHEIDII